MSESQPESNKSVEFFLPAKSLAKYLEDLTEASDPYKKQDIFKNIIEIFRFRGIGTNVRNSEKGLEDLMNFLKQSSNDPDLRELVSRFALAEGAECEKRQDFATALNLYQISIGIPIGDSQAAYFQNNNLGYCLNKLERFVEAEARLRNAIAINPERYNAWKNLGISLEAQGEVHAARDCYEKAVALSDGEPRSLALLKALEERRGE